MKMAPCPAIKGSWQVLEVLGNGGSGEGPSFKKGLPPKMHFHRNHYWCSCLHLWARVSCFRYAHESTVLDLSHARRFAGISIAPDTHCPENPFKVPP